MKRLAVAFSILFFAGISAAPPLPSSREPEFQFARLLVMPAVRAPVRQESLWRCPRCGKILMACEIEDRAEATLTQLLMVQLENFSGFETVTQEELNRALQAIPEPELTQARLDPGFPFLLAERLKADAVLIPTVSCFRERLGNALASGRPAAVAFELDLARVADRKLAWTGSYEEEQKPLLENLLLAKTFFRRGAKWVTVEVLAKDGMARAIADFPAKKTAAP